MDKPGWEGPLQCRIIPADIVSYTDTASSLVRYNLRPMGNGPPTYFDLLFVPGLLTFLGLVVYAVTTFRSRADGHLTPYRYIGIGFIAIAFLLGLRGVWDLLNPGLGAFYRASLAGYSKRFIAAHYFAAIAPLVILIGTIIADYFVRKSPID